MDQSKQHSLADPIMRTIFEIAIGLTFIACFVGMGWGYETKVRQQEETIRELIAEKKILHERVWAQKGKIRRLQQKIMTEANWVTRAILSETNDPDEQRLVAWVIRNRFERGYWGAQSYKDVVLEPYQFSAFNPGRPTRAKYLNMDASNERWAEAWQIAHDVITAKPGERPFPISVTHFYSPVSMPGYRSPYWASRLPRYEEVQVDPFRFRFHMNEI